MKKKLNALLLTFCIVFSVVAAVLPVYAIEEDGGIGVVGASESVLKVEKLVLNEDDVPEVISFQSAQEKGHVLRLRDKEADDYTVVFLNDDNTETMYLFAEPVKYTDEYGNKKDKSTALTLKNNAYTMAENDISVSFPREAANGISVSKGAINITMSPVATAVSDRLTASTDTEAKLGRISENKMVYTDVFTNASLVYTPLYSGFKEDIVLDSFDGVNEFSFIVNTNGLYPIKQENGAVWFYDPYTDELVAKMMQVVCYDSENDFSEGDVRITEVKENQIYTFTIIADAAFLSDENTAYPVYIDPTITLNTETAIEDTVVYTGKASRNYGTYSYLNVGYVDSSYKNGEMLVKFPTLAQNDVFSDLQSSYITSASLVYYTASGKSGTQRIQAYQLNMGNWDVNTVTWNSMPMLTVGNPPTLLSTATVSTSGGTPTTIDITNAARTWVDSSSSVTPNQGLLICNETENDATKCRDFMSVDYAASSSSREQYMPRLELSYLNNNVLTIADNDGIANGVLQVRKGYSIDLSITLTQNGVQVTLPRSMLQFTSSNTTIARFESSGSTTRSSSDIPLLKGVSVGNTRIQVSYIGPDDIRAATASMDVAVWEEEVVFAGQKHYDFNTHTQNRCTLSFYVLDKGIKKTPIFSIATNEQGDVSSDFINENAISISGQRVVKTNAYNQDFCYNHPTGLLKINVRYGNRTYNENLTVRVHCDDYDSPTELNDFTCVRINYPTEDENGGETLYELDINTEAAINTFLQKNDLLQGEGYDSINSTFQNIYDEETETSWMTNEDGQKFFELIRDSRMSIVLSHGNSSGCFVVNPDVGENGEPLVIDSDDICALPQGYFNSCELIMVICCYGGDFGLTDDEGFSLSLAEAFADRGAKRVVSVYGSVLQSDAQEFIYNFFAYLAYTEYDSIEYREPGIKPTYKGALQYAVKESFQPTGEGIPTTITFNAFDGTNLSKVDFYKNDARVATITGDGDFNEKFKE